MAGHPHLWKGIRLFVCYIPTRQLNHRLHSLLPLFVPLLLIYRSRLPHLPLLVLSSQPAAEQNN